MARGEWFWLSRLRSGWSFVGEVWRLSASSPLPWCLGEGVAFFSPQGGLCFVFPRRASVFSSMVVSLVDSRRRVRRVWLCSDVRRMVLRRRLIGPFFFLCHPLPTVLQVVKPLRLSVPGSWFGVSSSLLVRELRLSPAVFAFIK